MNSAKSIITYEYDINGIILSLVIKVINNETTYAPEPYFRSYNINLETQEVISDQTLLEYFNDKSIEFEIAAAPEEAKSEDVPYSRMIIHLII